MTRFNKEILGIDRKIGKYTFPEYPDVVIMLEPHHGYMDDEQLETYLINEINKRKGKMKLRGRRVLINIPERKESAIELSEKDKAMIEEEEMKMWTQLAVHAVGNDVTEIKAGDKVYLSVSAIQDAERVLIDGEVRLMINEGAIAIIW